MTLNRKIRIQFVKPGVHYYPQASSQPSLNDVNFLGNLHHHYFYFYVEVEVFHNDRDIEFIQFRRFCENLYDNKALALDHKSCEMIAEELIVQIRHKYPHRNITVEVYEDNINGSIVEYKKD